MCYIYGAMNQVKTRILPLESCPDDTLTYVVIGAREKGHWIFVRHRERSTWEMPAGHIEPGETADQAAVRELFEETGTFRSGLRGICDYAVVTDAETGYGRLYLAEVEERGALPDSEIAETMTQTGLPAELTYPAVQGALYKQLPACCDEE